MYTHVTCTNKYIEQKGTREITVVWRMYMHVTCTNKYIEQKGTREITVVRRMYMHVVFITKRRGNRMRETRVECRM